MSHAQEFHIANLVQCPAAAVRRSYLLPRPPCGSTCLYARVCWSWNKNVTDIHTHCYCTLQGLLRSLEIQVRIWLNHHRNIPVAISTADSVSSLAYLACRKSTQSAVPRWNVQGLISSKRAEHIRPTVAVSEVSCYPSSCATGTIKCLLILRKKKVFLSEFALLGCYTELLCNWLPVISGQPVGRIFKGQAIAIWHR